MYKILTEEQRTKLLLQHKTKRDKRVADRIKVVLLWDAGWSAETIATALLIDDATVRRHINLYKEDKRIHPEHKGYNPILTAIESEALSRHIAEACYVKAKDIQSYIRETYQKEMTVSTVTFWLKNNNFTYKKLKLVPKADIELQKKFIEDYKKLLDKAAVDNTPVLFGDGVHPSQ